MSGIFLDGLSIQKGKAVKSTDVIVSAIAESLGSWLTHPSDAAASSAIGIAASGQGGGGSFSSARPSSGLTEETLKFLTSVCLVKSVTIAAKKERIAFAATAAYSHPSTSSSHDHTSVSPNDRFVNDVVAEVSSLVASAPNDVAGIALDFTAALDGVEESNVSFPHGEVAVSASKSSAAGGMQHNPMRKTAVTAGIRGAVEKKDLHATVSTAAVEKSKNSQLQIAKSLPKAELLKLLRNVVDSSMSSWGRAFSRR